MSVRWLVAVFGSFWLVPRMALACAHVGTSVRADASRVLSFQDRRLDVVTGGDLIWLPPPSNRCVPGTEWPDFCLSRESNDIKMLRRDGTVAWSKKSPGELFGFEEHFAAPELVIGFREGARHRELWAARLRTGEEVWHVETSANRCRVIPERSLFVCATPRLEAFDLRTGSSAWSAPTGVEPVFVASSRELILLKDASASIQAVDLESGSVRWEKRPLRDAIRETFLMDAENLYLISGREVWALSLADGSTTWVWRSQITTETPEFRATDAFLTRGRLILVDAYAGVLIAIDPARKEMPWVEHLSDPPIVEVAAKDGVVALATNIRALALSAEDGRVQWTEESTEIDWPRLRVILLLLTLAFFLRSRGSWVRRSVGWTQFDLGPLGRTWARSLPLVAAWLVLWISQYAPRPELPDISFAFTLAAFSLLMAAATTTVRVEKSGLTLSAGILGLRRRWSTDQIANIRSCPGLGLKITTRGVGPSLILRRVDIDTVDRVATEVRRRTVRRVAEPGALSHPVDVAADGALSISEGGEVSVVD